MRDILPQLSQWQAAGDAFAVATVIETWGSSPRPAGSAMGIRADGLICGSVSGGCIEAAVIEEALLAISDRKPRTLCFDQISENALWEVGLSCGGAIKVWINPCFTLTDDLRLALQESEELWIRTDFATGEQSLAREAMESSVHVAARDRLVIFGASHMAIPLIAFAKSLGFEVTLVDPRSSLLRPERFPVQPDRAVLAWPSEWGLLTPESYVVALSHSSRIDDVAVALALRTGVRYVGALGSRRTQEQRRRALKNQGFTAVEIAKVHGPVGLAIGALTPEEIALSIMAEIVQVRRAPH